MPVRTEVLMGTLVTIHVVRPGADDAIARAFGWFREIEARCTRFDERSELMRLCACIGAPVPASAILFEAVRFALSVADDTGGAFDPTVGEAMVRRGFNREHRTGRTSQAPSATRQGASYRDIVLDERCRTIRLRRPLTLDLGAVAKGLAVDAAARELRPFEDFAIDAGGDLYLGGRNPAGEPWSVGIRHPRRDGHVFDSLRVSNTAVCTSGDYERLVACADTGLAPAAGREHHVLDPRTGSSPTDLASVTVVAPGAMLADALATAALVLGRVEGLALLHRHGVEGLLLTDTLARHETAGLRRA